MADACDTQQNAPTVKEHAQPDSWVNRGLFKKRKDMDILDWLPRKLLVPK